MLRTGGEAPRQSLELCFSRSCELRLLTLEIAALGPPGGTWGPESAIFVSSVSGFGTSFLPVSLGEKSQASGDNGKTQMGEDPFLVRGWLEQSRDPSPVIQTGLKDLLGVF